MQKNDKKHVSDAYAAVYGFSVSACRAVNDTESAVESGMNDGTGNGQTNGADESGANNGTNDNGTNGGALNGTENGTLNETDQAGTSAGINGNAR